MLNKYRLCDTVDKSLPESRSPAVGSRCSGDGVPRDGSDAAKTSLQTSGQNSDAGMLTGAVSTSRLLAHYQIFRPFPVALALFTFYYMFAMLC